MKPVQHRGRPLVGPGAIERLIGPLEYLEARIVVEGCRERGTICALAEEGIARFTRIFQAAAKETWAPPPPVQAPPPPIQAPPPPVQAPPAATTQPVAPEVQQAVPTAAVENLTTKVSELAAALEQQLAERTSLEARVKLLEQQLAERTSLEARVKLLEQQLAERTSLEARVKLLEQQLAERAAPAAEDSKLPAAEVREPASAQASEPAAQVFEPPAAQRAVPVSKAQGKGAWKPGKKPPRIHGKEYAIEMGYRRQLGFQLLEPNGEYRGLNEGLNALDGLWDDGTCGTPKGWWFRTQEALDQARALVAQGKPAGAAPARQETEAGPRLPSRDRELNNSFLRKLDRATSAEAALESLLEQVPGPSDGGP